MNIFKREIKGGAKIQLIEVPKVNEKNIVGADMFPGIIGLLANILLFAKKRSGKTNTLANILLTCAGKNTIIVIFCATFYKDLAWIEIKKKMDKLGLNYIIRTSLYNDNRNNELEILLNYIIKKSEYDAQMEELEKISKIPNQITGPISVKFNDAIAIAGQGVIHPIDIPNPEIKFKKEKEVAPEYLFIFDDLSSEIKDKQIARLMKINRNLRSKVIISTQYINDILPDARQQIDYCILFGKIPDDKLIEIHHDCGISLDFNVFKQIYEDATYEKYNFLKINTRDDTFSKNFDIAYDINDMPVK